MPHKKCPVKNPRNESLAKNAPPYLLPFRNKFTSLLFFASSLSASTSRPILAGLHRQPAAQTNKQFILIGCEGNSVVKRRKRHLPKRLPLFCKSQTQYHCFLLLHFGSNPDTSADGPHELVVDQMGVRNEHEKQEARKCGVLVFGEPHTPIII